MKLLIFVGLKLTLNAGKIKSNDQSDEVAMLRREKEGLKEEVRSARPDMILLVVYRTHQ